MSCADPHCDDDRERKMTVIERDSQGVPTVWCDPCIASIVSALNSAGIGTVASCCGHRRQLGRISLRDGRELFIAPDYESAQRLSPATAPSPAETHK